ncbi:MAG: 7-cyano-7-deazaguanine synthase [Pirellulales bacterium]|nr:7-cyano-7-deazaguanine synthase [Pirellulales bacterium]
MTQPARPADVGLLLSGGLDSAILLGHLLAGGERVQPFYVRAHLHWEAAEERAARRFCAALASPALAELVTLEMPVADLYRNHWSVTGEQVPDASTPDEAVYLPGRNALLVIKAALWCQLQGIPELALAPLSSNPFADASDRFFSTFEAALNLAGEGTLRVIRPFGHLHKRDVMLLGRGMPLELTLSCIAPVGDDHCGECNKCAERQEAFRAAGMSDPTRYATQVK